MMEIYKHSGVYKKIGLMQTGTIEITHVTQLLVHHSNHTNIIGRNRALKAIHLCVSHKGIHQACVAEVLVVVMLAPRGRALSGPGTQIVLMPAHGITVRAIRGLKARQGNRKVSPNALALAQIRNLEAMENLLRRVCHVTRHDANSGATRRERTKSGRHC